MAIHFSTTLMNITKSYENNIMNLFLKLECRIVYRKNKILQVSNC
ncbi:hypothetical protein LEP1GSC021_2860 [Leptospira noguchii str. 1993005606]|uniref:Uncharacterized protein n=2 Tax=Leptospira noguchii TaxID=28182 RepID=M6YM98_9LEPT|nr:hypothetical protein LEP1GSC035_0029 [Leptospira noguchii str. 2007001578]EMO90749.1 hypothetical protein LEP1GSC024_1265 [Leptospira noguchii str. 2001034031]EPE85039.1 hypothetical protein LEP1GSC021_2860 [Leptospira noguchii str. 1993005606]